MIEQHSFAALVASLSVGLLLAAAPNDSAAASLAFGPGAIVPAAPFALLPAAEKKSTKASQQRSTKTKSTTTKKVTTTTTKTKPSTSTAKQKQPSSNTGSGSIGGGTKTTGTGSNTKTPGAKSGDVVTKERGTVSTTGKSLNDLLSGKTPTKETKSLPSEDKTPVLNAPAEGEGTTYTSQQVTQEQMDQYAEEHPDELSDSDGDGVYESTVELGQNAQVVVEDGNAYLDRDGDGEIDAVVPAQYYDAETNTFKIPVNADNYTISNNFGDQVGYVEGEQAAVYADLDGDGVDEVYVGYDLDGDGVADTVDLEPLQVGGDRLTENELADMIESGEIKSVEYPDFGQNYNEENGNHVEENGTKQRPRVNVGLSVAPAPSAANGAAAGGGLDANAMVANLQQLKMLREQGVLSAVEHDNAQLRALAEINAQQTGIEGGLGLLRQLWENDLITQAPYARKRQELLDAL